MQQGLRTVLVQIGLSERSNPECAVAAQDRSARNRRNRIRRHRAFGGLSPGCRVDLLSPGSLP